MMTITKNPIKQEICVQIDRDGICVQYIIAVTDTDKYTLEETALLAEGIKTDIIDNIIILEDMEDGEEDDIL